VLQADRMADFVNRGHEEALVIAGPRSYRQVQTEVHDRAHDGVELRAVRRGDGIGQRSGPPKPSTPGGRSSKVTSPRECSAGGAIFEASEHILRSEDETPFQTVVACSIWLRTELNVSVEV